MTELIGTIAMILAVTGVWLNNRKIRACFYFWLFSNTFSACLHLYGGMYALMIRDVIFIVLAIEGLKKWSR
jgi:nicotinamide riboside transporter PnuC